MGHKQAKPLPSSKAGYYPDVEVVQAKHIDPHYGEVRYVRDKRTNQLLVLKEIIVNTKQAFDAEADFLHHRVALKHPNVVEIIGFNTVDQTSFCASSYKISVYIEVQEKTLQAQLNDRIFNRQAYTEGEITHVAECLISALSYFQNKGHNHGDIRPANIFVKANTIKLSDPTISSFRGANALTLVALHGQKCYLAPELLGNIIKKTFDAKTDKHKADVWSTGVTLLALATLSNCEDLYNYKLGSLNEGLLAERLNQVRAKYSPRLYDLIRSMLTLDERVRPDFATLAKQLNVIQPTSPSLPLQQAPVTTYQAPISQPVQQVPVRSSLPPQQYVPSPGVTRSALPTTLNTPVQQYTPQTYTPQTYTPSTYYSQYLPSTTVAPTTTLPATTEVPKQSTLPGSYLTSNPEVLKRSSIPTTYSTAPITTYAPTTYTPSTYAPTTYSYPATTVGTTEGLKRSTIGTTPYSYTVPSTYSYPTTTVGTTEGLKRSAIPGTYSSYPAYSTAYPGSYSAYPGYSTVGSYGLASPLVRPVDANANINAPGANVQAATPTAGSTNNAAPAGSVGSVKAGSGVLP